MSFKDWISSLFIKKGIERTAAARFQDTPIYPTDDFVDNANGGYSYNSLVYAAINEITSSLIEAPLKAVDASKVPLTSHPTIELLKKPNPIMSGYEFLELTVIHMYLSGNAFWYKVRQGKGKIIELWALRPDRLRVVTGGDKVVANYIYEIDGTRYTIPTEDILHFRFPNPTNEFLGMSPLRAAVRRIATDNDLTDMTKVTLQNGGVPLGILKSENVINEHVAQRIKSQWKQSYGRGNRGELAVISGSMEYQPISFNMNELAMVDVNAINETRILMAFGVPPILIGAKSGLESSTYANYKEARQSFWEETISTLQRRLTAKLETDSELAAGGVSFIFDSADVPALADKRQQKFDNAMLALQSGLLTLNEARLEVGYAPIEDIEPEMAGESEEDQAEDVQEEAVTVQRRSVKEYEEALEKKSRELDLLRESLNTLSAADKHYDRFEHWAKKELKRQGLEYASMLRDALNQKGETSLERKEDVASFDPTIPIPPEMLDSMRKGLNELEQSWKSEVSRSIEPIMTSLMKEAGQQAAKKVHLAYDIRNEEVIAFIDNHKYRFAESISKTSVESIKSILTKATETGMSLNDISTELKETFGGDMAKARATMIARTETIRAANEGTRAVYKAAGVEKMTWLSSTDACPYCMGLHGKTVSVDAPFLTTADHYEPAGTQRPLSMNYGDIPSPPLHPGCRCTITPES